MLYRLLTRLHELSAVPPAARQYSVVFVPFCHAILADGEQAAAQAAWGSHDPRWHQLVADYRAFYTVNDSLSPLLEPNTVRDVNTQVPARHDGEWPYIHAAPRTQEPENAMHAWPLQSPGLGYTQEGLLSQSVTLFAQLQAMVLEWTQALQLQPPVPALPVGRGQQDDASRGATNHRNDGERREATARRVNNYFEDGSGLSDAAGGLAEGTDDSDDNSIVVSDEDRQAGGRTARRDDDDDADEGDGLPRVSDDAPDADVWSVIRAYGEQPYDHEEMRTLIARLRRRPQNVDLQSTRWQHSEHASSQVQQLATLHRLWYQQEPPAQEDAARAAYGRMLQAIRYRHQTRWAHVLAGQQQLRRPQRLRNAARDNRRLLAGTAPPIATHWAGVLQTGDPEVDDHHVAPQYQSCSLCNSGLYVGEVMRAHGRICGRRCCRQGRVLLRPLQWDTDAEVGQLMRRMWLTRPARLSEASLARRHGRLLNSTFAMSCQSVQCRPMLTRGMQTFVVNTRVAHFMGALLPDEGERPQFAQLYVHDAYSNVPVGVRHDRHSFRDALSHYFANSRSNRIGRETQTALLALVDAWRAPLLRVRCLGGHVIAFI